MPPSPRLAEAWRLVVDQPTTVLRVVYSREGSVRLARNLEFNVLPKRGDDGIWRWIPASVM